MTTTQPNIVPKPFRIQVSLSLVDNIESAEDSVQEWMRRQQAADLETLVVRVRQERLIRVDRRRYVAVVVGEQLVPGNLMTPDPTVELLNSLADWLTLTLGQEVATIDYGSVRWDRPSRKAEAEAAASKVP
ncbi:MAG: hypothetical protein K0S68_1005 [Candidatus Saccharibacteria bacterium]|jgi:hypothetical protein|nr:hypothetical protein [Candidatus Saccharibacteria bacterium]